MNETIVCFDWLVLFLKMLDIGPMDLMDARLMDSRASWLHSPVSTSLLPLPGTDTTSTAPVRTMAGHMMERVWWTGRGGGEVQGRLSFDCSCSCLDHPVSKEATCSTLVSVHDMKPCPEATLLVSGVWIASPYIIRHLFKAHSSFMVLICSEKKGHCHF